MRSALDLARRDAADLVQLGHEVDPGVEAAGRVDEQDVAVARLARRDGVEDDGRRVGARARPDEIHPRARRPDLELLHGSRAERIGGADEGRPPAVLDEARQLADGRRLARAVDADDHHDVWPMAVGGGHIGGAKDLEDLGLDEIAQRRVPAIPGADGVDDALCRGDADVSRDQRLLECVDRLDVDRSASLLGRIRATDHVLELLDELLLGP